VAYAGAPDFYSSLGNALTQAVVPRRRNDLHKNLRRKERVCDSGV